MIQLKKKEVLLIFVMFVTVAAIVFSMGLFIGYELKSLNVPKIDERK